MRAIHIFSYSLEMEGFLWPISIGSVAECNFKLQLKSQCIEFKPEFKRGHNKKEKYYALSKKVIALNEMSKLGS